MIPTEATCTSDLSTIYEVNNNGSTQINVIPVALYLLLLTTEIRFVDLQNGSKYPCGCDSHLLQYCMSGTTTLRFTG